MKATLEYGTNSLKDQAFDQIAKGCDYSFTGSRALEYQERIESNARSYPRRIPLVLDQAEGIYVKDEEGRFFIDCLGGAGTLALGHNHSSLKQAVSEVMDSNLPLHTLDITTKVKVEFKSELFKTLPKNFAENARIQFCGPAGTDAVEAVIKLMKIATGRSNVFAFHGAYHGMTHGSLSLTGNLGAKSDVDHLMGGVHFFPYPYEYRCPFGKGGAEGALLSLSYLRSVLEDPESGICKPAAIILEAVQGEGGVIPAPISWLRELREITKDHDVPLIIDEVQTGMGRTGFYYAFERAGIEPDAVVLSKAIGGSLPLAVVIYNKNYDKWQSGAHAGTFRGNQMAMAAGTATIKIIRETGLLGNVQEQGEYLMGRLKALERRFEFIGQARGVGLMLGMEFVKDSKSKEHNPQLAREFQQKCLKRGLILELGGRHSSVVRLLPPLIINKDEVKLVAEILEEVCTELYADFLMPEREESIA
ncbi:MAG: diaminobutyrate--2-oxoglutarate transaminase [Lentisphaerales bacterium]|nr:diaminobutyrate--2-oxoglutarate transaminase [Lentisphaerales bacterium]